MSCLFLCFFKKYQTDSVKTVQCTVPTIAPCVLPSSVRIGQWPAAVINTRKRPSDFRNGDAVDGNLGAEYSDNRRTAACSSQFSSHNCADKPV